MKGKSSWNYFGVKIIKQIIVEGEPDPALIDAFYDDDDEQFFEESMLLIRAQSSEHACKLAKKKATEHEQPRPNPYGQQVLWKYIDTVDCFEMLDELKSGAEVYSCFHVTKKEESAQAFIKKWFNSSDC